MAVAMEDARAGTENNSSRNISIVLWLGYGKISVVDFVKVGRSAI